MIIIDDMLGGAPRGRLPGRGFPEKGGSGAISVPTARSRVKSCWIALLGSLRPAADRTKVLAYS